MKWENMIKSGLLVNFIFVLLVFFKNSVSGSYDLEGKDIRDSTSLINKISSPKDPLHKYFVKVLPGSREDIIQVINKRVIPDKMFSYDVSGLSYDGKENVTRNGNDSENDIIMVNNRDLLTELYPKEIVPRNIEIISQNFNIKTPVKKIEQVDWLKAEVMSWLNDIISNEHVMSNWENVKDFFDENITNEEIKIFTGEIKSFQAEIIPINSISLKVNFPDSTANVYVKRKGSESMEKIFKMSFENNKKWKILSIKDINSKLLESGYISKKR
jgi:hypothetical protein